MLNTVRRNTSLLYDGLIKILKRPSVEGKRPFGQDAGKCPPAWDASSQQSDEDFSVSAERLLGYINKLYKQTVGNNQGVFPVIILRGEGVYVWDHFGNKYLDFTSADSTVMLGHCHKGIIAALHEQAEVLTQSSKFCQNYPLALLSSYMTELFGYDKVVMMNSGSEAVETAIKIARNFGYKLKGIPDNQAKIVIPRNCHFGKTITAISASGKKDFLHKLGPHLPGFEIVPFNNVKILEEKLKNPNVCGFLVEPIQAEAGVILPQPRYLCEARRICSENNVLLMADEIQTGLGRCGSLTCCSTYSMTPDILILGKALSGGSVPVSATMADKIFFDLVEDDGVFGSTYGGFPLGCMAALAALEGLVDENLITNSRKMGEVLQQALETTLPKECVKCIRGKGLLYGVELQGVFRGPASVKLFYDLLCNGLFIKPPLNGVIHLCPPLCINEGQIIEAVKKLQNSLLKLRGYAELEWRDISEHCKKQCKEREAGNKNQMQNNDCEGEGNNNNPCAGGNPRKQAKSQMPQKPTNANNDRNNQCEKEDGQAKMAQKKNPKDTDPCKPSKPTFEFSPNDNTAEIIEKYLRRQRQNRSMRPPFHAPDAGSTISKASDRFSDPSLYYENYAMTPCPPTVKTSSPKKDICDDPGEISSLVQYKARKKDEWVDVEDFCVESPTGPNKMEDQNKSCVSDDGLEIWKNIPSKMKKGENKNSDSAECSDPPTKRKLNFDDGDCAYGNESPGGKMKRTDKGEPCAEDEMPTKSKQPICSKFPYSSSSQQPPTKEELLRVFPCIENFDYRALEDTKIQEPSSQDQPKVQPCPEDRKSEDAEKKSSGDKCAQVEDRCKGGDAQRPPSSEEEKKRKAELLKKCKANFGPVGQEDSCKENPFQKNKAKQEEACKPPEDKPAPCRIEICKPSGESKQQQGEKPCPPSQEQKEKPKPFEYLPTSSSEKFECVPVSKRTDRGKQPMTSKGAQPIPKKTGKKFYPDDGAIPSTSTGIVHDYECPSPVLNSPSEKEKPKNDECKKPSNENAKPDCKPGSSKN